MAIDYEAKIKALKAEQAALDDSAEAKTRQLEITKALAEANRDYAASAGASVGELTEQTQKLNAATEALKEHTKAKEDAAKAVTKAAEEQKKALDELTATQDAYTTNLENTVRTMTGMTTGNETLIGSWMNMKKQAGLLTKEIEDLEKKVQAGIDSGNEDAEATDKLAKAKDRQAKSTQSLDDKIKKYVENINPIASIVSTISQATMLMAAENDKATAAFNASSGAAGAYDRELVALQQSNIQHGISAADMGDSYGALQNSLSGFGVMAESERMRLGELGAQFAKVGVSGADFAGTLETMTRGFGMSTNAATGMQEEAMELAQTLGKDVGTVLSEMNAALPQLASYGDDAVDMFFDLEKQAQRTGLAVGDLISIAGNYRTFDSAAEAAGNLNAVLGTQLFSSMGLLEAQLEGPEAVIAYMSQNLSDSIGDWDSLNTFQKEAVANAANMNVEEMNHLMNQKSLTKQEKDRAATLEESMAAGRDLWQELTIFAQNFAIAVTPIVNTLVGGFQLINAGVAGFKEHFGWLIEAVKTFSIIWAIVWGAGTLQAMATANNLIKIQTALSVKLAAVRTFLAGLNPLTMGLIATATVAAMVIRSKFDSHAKGTDSTSGRMALVGEEGPEGLVSPDGRKGGIVGANGPEFIHPPKGSAVINNTTMTTLASQATSRSVAGVGSSTAMAASIAALGGAMKEMSNRPIEVTTNPVMLKENFRGGLNEATGGYGTQPIRLKTA